MATSALARTPAPQASQFDLPFTPYPRGEYYLDVRATSGGLETDRLLSIRLTR